MAQVLPSQKILLLDIRGEPSDLDRLALFKAHLREPFLEMLIFLFALTSRLLEKPALKTPKPALKHPNLHLKRKVNMIKIRT